MNDQITLDGFEPIDSKEREFINVFWAHLTNAVGNAGGDEAQLTMSATAAEKSKESNSGYTVVKLGNLTVFRLCLRGRQHYISVPTSLADLIPSEFPTKKLQSDPKYCRILIATNDHPVKYADFLIQLTAETINRYPKEWDCCSRYEKCSDAKKCVHPDKAFALGCGYRRILSSGKVFYGSNRNID